MRNSGRKIIYSNSANIITPSVKTRSSNVQVCHVLKVIKPKISPKQFNELSELKILGFTSSRDFLLLLISLLAELFLDAFDDQPSAAVSLSRQQFLGRNNSLSRIIESLQVLCS